MSDPSLPVLLRALRLPAFGRNYDRLADRARDQGETFESYLRQLVDLELEGRADRRLGIGRKLLDVLLRSSSLPVPLIV